jgi:hypothetical protein
VKNDKGLKRWEKMGIKLRRDGGTEVRSYGVTEGLRAELFEKLIE